MREPTAWPGAGCRCRSTVAVPVAVLLLVFAAPLAGVFVHEPDALAAQPPDWVRVYAVAVVLRSLYGVLRGSSRLAG